MAGGNLSGHGVVSSQTGGGADKDSQIATLKKQLAAQSKNN